MKLEFTKEELEVLSIALIIYRQQQRDILEGISSFYRHRDTEPLVANDKDLQNAQTSHERGATIAEKIYKVITKARLGMEPTKE